MEEENYIFALLDERYLEGKDCRSIVQYDEEKFAVCVWGDEKIYTINRDKVDGCIIGFAC